MMINRSQNACRMLPEKMSLDGLYDRRSADGRVLPVLDRLDSSLAKRTTLVFFCGCACWL